MSSLNRINEVVDAVNSFVYFCMTALTLILLCRYLSSFMLLGRYINVHPSSYIQLNVHSLLIYPSSKIVVEIVLNNKLEYIFLRLNMNFLKRLMFSSEYTVINQDYL